jgi:hypothetical protein
MVIHTVRPLRARALHPLQETTMSSFALYLIGMVIVIGGLAYAAYLLHIPSQWIGIGVVVLLGAGIIGAVTHTRRRDPPES